MRKALRPSPIEMPKLVAHRRRGPAAQCTDEVVGAILSGWRYDISGLSPAMRADYDQHFSECTHCRSKQRLHRTVDVLLISIFSLWIVAFFLAAVVMHIHRIEMLSRVGQVHVHVWHAAVYISLEAVAIAGMFFSTLLWILVAIATPLPEYLGGLLQQRIPEDLRQRFSKDAA